MANEPLSVFSFSSLTDIVMLLLIFFLLSSQFVIQTGVKVKLPGAKNNEQQSSSQFVVTITTDSRFYFGSEEVTLNTLPIKIDEMLQKSNDPNFIISADKTVPIDQVVKVMDIAKGLGIKKLTISTEKISY